MQNAVLSPGEYVLAKRILLEGGEKYGTAAIERISRAFAIAAGLEQAPTPESRAQRPELIFPGLTARPWHNASDYGFCRDVEGAAGVIRKELEAVSSSADGFQPYRQDQYVPEGNWDAFYFRIGNTWLDENRNLCPQTVRILESVPRLAEVAMFSALSAGGHIAPHCGAWNCRITFHLGLVVPEGCALRVGKEARAWEPGKLMAFDDTFEHEAWNKSDKARCVLLFDVWHPDLSDIEVGLLEELRARAGVRDGKCTVKQIRADRIKHRGSVRSSGRPESPGTCSIDWSRLAEPQADQYDTDVVLRLASSTFSAGRPRPYVRTPIGQAPTAFDGEVAIRHVYRSLPEFASISTHYPDAPADHPNIGMAAEHIRKWSAAFTQCQRLLEAIHPAMDPRVPLLSTAIYRGSSSHSFEQLFGSMWATIFCPIGLAEAIVHEMAHQKLRVLGVSFESATAVVGNDPSDLYVSPIIKDRQRPMTAVLHAEYSYVYVTALDIHLVEAEPDSAKRKVLSRMLERNLSRIEEGYDTIRRHFKPGEHGREFMEGFYAWTERTIASAAQLLGRGSRHGGAQDRPCPVSVARPGPRMSRNLLDAQTPAVFAYNGGIGDRLCNLPALRALDALFPERLALLCAKGDKQLYYSDLKLRAAHELDFEQLPTGWTFDAEALVRRMGQCDLLISINPWHTGSVSQLLARFPHAESVGFFPEFRRHLACDYEGHAMDMAFAVPAFLGTSLQLSDFSQPPALSQMACAAAREFRRRYVGSQRTLFVHTDTKPEKRWPRERFEAVIETFLGEFPEFTALVVDVHGEGIVRGRFPDLVLPVSVPLEVCLALLRDSDLFLGIDSCHLHAADLFRIPGVGLFGPTSCRRWGYRFDTDHRHFQGPGRMDTIKVDQVCEGLRTLAWVGRPSSLRSTMGA
jgi:HEXXH motif-containing protein